MISFLHMGAVSGVEERTRKVYSFALGVRLFYFGPRSVLSWEKSSSDLDAFYTKLIYTTKHD